VKSFHPLKKKNHQDRSILHSLKGGTLFHNSNNNITVGIKGDTQKKMLFRSRNQDESAFLGGGGTNRCLEGLFPFNEEDEVQDAVNQSQLRILSAYKEFLLDPGTVTIVNNPGGELEEEEEECAPSSPTRSQSMSGATPPTPSSNSKRKRPPMLIDIKVLRFLTEFSFSPKTALENWKKRIFESEVPNHSAEDAEEEVPSFGSRQEDSLIKIMVFEHLKEFFNSQQAVLKGAIPFVKKFGWSDL
jgi:hypothetical protein